MPRSLLARFAVTDARGVRVPLRTLRDRRLGLEGAGRAAELRARLRRRPFWQSLSDWVFYGALIGIALPIITTAILAPWRGRGHLIDSLVAGAILLLPIVLLRFLLVHLFAPRAAARAAQDFLRLGHCPACAYDLAHVEPDADSITTCPECGAAWRGVQRPTPQAAHPAPAPAAP